MQKNLIFILFYCLNHVSQSFLSINSTEIVWSGTFINLVEYSMTGLPVHFISNFLTSLNRKMMIFCSANLRAMHDLIPCPNGRLVYGLMSFLEPSVPLNHRSGLNSPGLSKFLSSKLATWVCVTITVYDINK